MKHEKNIKRDDGTRYNIIVRAYTKSYGNDPIVYSVNVLFKEKGKRKWKVLPDTLHDFQFRKLDLVDRGEHKYKNMLRFVSEDEIHSAKLELWDLMKPKK